MALIDLARINKLFIYSSFHFLHVALYELFELFKEYTFLFLLSTKQSIDFHYSIAGMQSACFFLLVLPNLNCRSWYIKYMTKMPLYRPSLHVLSIITAVSFLDYLVTLWVLPVCCCDWLILVQKSFSWVFLHSRRLVKSTFLFLWIPWLLLISISLPFTVLICLILLTSWFYIILILFWKIDVKNITYYA